jgi:hypothetical protein
VGHLRQRLRRTTLGLVAVAALAWLIAPAAAQVAPSDVTVERHGWWNFANGGPQSGAPSDPTAGLGLPTLPRPPTVPEGAIAVGAGLGEEDKVGALGFSPLPVEEGGSVTTFTVTLKEAAEPGANQSASSAVIVACPIVTFWITGENGRWDTRPEADCDTAKATGQRGEDGTWVFDLTAVANAWVDPFGSIPQDGVLFLPEVEPPTSFQVSFADVAGQGVQVDFAATPGDPADDPFATDGEFDTGGDDLAGGADEGFGDGGFAENPVDPGDPAPAPEPPAEEGGGPETGTDAGPAASQGSVFAGLPWGAVVLVPLALGLAVLMSLALGPGGEPERHVRQGGVTQALARRSRPTPTPSPAMEAT